MTRSHGGNTCGRLRGVEHLDLDAPPGQPARRGAPVGAVVALAGDDDDPLAVGAPEHAQGVAGDRASRPLDQHLDRLLGRGVDRRHLVGGEDRDHVAMTTASAVTSVCVIDRWNSVTALVAASAAAPPGQQQAGLARRRPHHLDLVELERAEADAQRLHRRFLGREPSREPRRGVARPLAVGPLGVGEQTRERRRACARARAGSGRSRPDVRIPIPGRPSLDGDCLSQVAGLVDVVAARLGHA